MSDPCQNCVTMLLNESPLHGTTEADTTRGYVEHDDARCRDVLHAQLTAERAKVEEAERDLEDALNEVSSQRPSWFRVRNILNGALLKIRDRAALEKLRGQ